METVRDIASELVENILLVARDKGEPYAKLEGADLVLGNLGRMLQAAVNAEPGSQATKEEAKRLDNSTDTEFNVRGASDNADISPTISRGEAVFLRCKDTGGSVKIRKHMGHFQMMGFKSVESLQKAALDDPRLEKIGPGTFSIASGGKND